MGDEGFEQYIENVRGSSSWWPDCGSCPRERARSGISSRRSSSDHWPTSKSIPLR